MVFLLLVSPSTTLGLQSILHPTEWPKNWAKQKTQMRSHYSLASHSLILPFIIYNKTQTPPTQQQKTKQPNLKTGKGLRHFSEEVQMAKTHMERCSAALINRNMQMRYHLTPIRWLLSHNNKRKTTVREAAEKLEPLCLVAGTIKHYSHCGEQYGDSSKLKNRITVRFSNSASGCIRRRIEGSVLKRYLYTLVHNG